MGGQHFITNLKTWGEEQENFPKLVRKERCRRLADQLRCNRGWQTERWIKQSSSAWFPEYLNNHQLFVNLRSYINACKTIVWKDKTWKLLFILHYFLSTYPSVTSSLSSFRHPEKRNNSLSPRSYGQKSEWPEDRGEALRQLRNWKFEQTTGKLSDTLISITKHNFQKSSLFK